MEKLVIKKDDALVDEVPIDKQIVTIGRDAESDLQLNDPSVSRHHATIRRIYTDLYIEDLGSTNGTQLNGRAVTKHVLKPGDQLVIGSFLLDMLDDVPEGAADEDLDKTVVLQPQAVAAARAGQTRPVRKLQPKSATLHFMRGPNKGHQEKIDRSLYTIGKPGENVAVIARRPQGFYLLHIGGSSFPRINDKEIDSKGGVQLHEGDVVEVGEYRAEISFVQ
ncbi:FHA domain-containing protein [Sedimenticola hydrogenitrophicus]|uniref:FHA domain-containing protein n=1 Tax=Sedimenticola hydrogenitrophicus TaxID=2967975 RepID=UPI0021A56F5E|nr:FHA domain-containing protein [Sedimenticola hydrogenitrophicus]